MTIDLNKDMFIYGMWFCGNNEVDLMGALFKKKDDFWEFKYRFRYHNDDKAFDSEDEKRWYHVKTHDTTPDKILEPIKDFTTLLAKGLNSTVEFIELKCQGDDKKVLKILSSRPWYNSKQVKEHTLKRSKHRNKEGGYDMWLDGEFLDPKPSQEVYNHSPDGFAWGYGGSGAAQLALAIMLKLTGKAEGYQDFKSNVIAQIDQKALHATFYIPSEGST